jgi:hypothetical protein
MLLPLNPLSRLKAELEAAGFRIEAVSAADMARGAGGETKDRVLRTHCIYREDILIAEATISPEAELSAMDVKSDFDSTKTLRDIFDRYRRLAFWDKPRDIKFSFLKDLVCSGCQGHGGWGGLNTPFIRCEACNGTGRLFSK